MKRISAFAAAGMILTAMLAQAAEGGLNIFQILDRFIVSNSAAVRCYKPAPGELKDFQVQYLNLMIRVRLELENQRPDATEEKIVASMRARHDKLDSGVARLIDERGCDSEQVKQLVDLFKFHASIDLMQPPQD